MAIAEKILNRLNISKPQKKFLMTLFTTILIARGKINFRNLSRYSHLCERTYTRQFDKPFRFMDFNRAIINESRDQDQAHGRILVLDASFVPKSGKKTYGLDHFWNGCQSRREKGLEILGVALVDVDKNTGFTLSVCQTVPKTDTAKGKKTTATKTNKNAQTEDETRIDQYLAHLREVHPCLEADETYLAVDGYFSKKKFIDGVANLKLHQIGKLRCDANMRYLYTGPKREKGSGNQKTYDGKVDWQDLSRFTYHHTQDGIALYGKPVIDAVFHKLSAHGRRWKNACDAGYTTLQCRRREPTEPPYAYGKIGDQSPADPIEGRTLAWRQRFPNAMEVYCAPWSEWWITLCGRRCQSAPFHDNTEIQEAAWCASYLQESSMLQAQC